MSLSVSTLQTALGQIMDPNHMSMGVPPVNDFKGYPNSPAAAAANWANAYDTYASAATDPYGNGVLTAYKSLFQSNLASWTPSTSGVPTTPAQAAALFGTAFSAYWMGALLQFTAFPPTLASAASNVVSGVVPASLIAALTKAFGTTYASGSAAAAALASIFHTATTSSLVTTITGLTPGGSPLSVSGVLS